MNILYQYKDKYDYDVLFEYTTCPAETYTGQYVITPYTENCLGILGGRTSGILGDEYARSYLPSIAGV